MRSSPVLQDVDPAAWGSHRFGLPESRWEALSGTCAWITGAGTGYGRAISIALAVAGATVYLTGRRSEKLHETLAAATQLGAASGRCVVLPADITDLSQLNQAARHIAARSSLLHAMVHCAALPEPGGIASPLAVLPPATWTRLFETNVTAQWLAARAALPLLEKSGSPRMVFLTSEAGWASTPDFGPYNVSKAALNSLGVSMAAEWKRDRPGLDIQVNVLVPGEAHTEMNQGSTESPFKVVSMTLALLSHPTRGPNGCFFHRDGRHLGFAYAEPFDEDVL